LWVFFEPSSCSEIGIDIYTHLRVANLCSRRTLFKLGQETALADTIPKFWPRILKAFEDNEFDFPFALVYSVVEDPEDTDDTSSLYASSISQSSDSSVVTKSCVLEGSLGVPDDHPAAPRRLDLKRSRGGFIPSFREAMKTREPKLLNLTDGSILESLIEGIKWRGFGEPCREVVICPVRPTTSENILGFLVVGINPRRPYDEDYQSFIRLIDRQLATSLAATSLFESEVRRGLTAAEAAALERSRLSEELAVQRSRLQRIAEVSPVGMFSIDPSGMLLEANDRWFEMTNHSRDIIYPMSWLDVFAESSLELLNGGWERLTVDGMPWSAELQRKSNWIEPHTGEEVDFWMLAAAQPEFADGELKMIMGSITDITFQKRSAKDAETRAKLSEQLLLRTQEAKENEKNFKRFSDLAPGGLVIMTPEGVIEYANSQWYTISGHPKELEITAAPLSWTNAIAKDDQAFFSSKWDELISQKRTITLEARMQTPWEGEIGGSIIKTQRWILASIYPEVDDDGSLKSVMGCKFYSARYYPQVFI
jgi:PAS domain S-box-containing protein